MFYTHISFAYILKKLYIASLVLVDQNWGFNLINQMSGDSDCLLVYHTHPHPLYIYIVIAY